MTELELLKKPEYIHVVLKHLPRLSPFNSRGKKPGIDQSLSARGRVGFRGGDRVRIRFGNLSPMEHHPIHLHGYYWKVTEMDGLQVPESAQQPGNTVLVAVGQTMTMGESGMGDMGEMGMPVPRNSIPMVGAPGKHEGP